VKANLKPEQSGKAWGWRVLLGPAMLLDGVLATLSLGTLNAGAALGAARRLAAERFVNAICHEKRTLS
jgi:hypothetical protein